MMYIIDTLLLLCMHVFIIFIFLRGCVCVCVCVWQKKRAVAYCPLFLPQKTNASSIAGAGMACELHPGVY